MKQKARPIPLELQEEVGKELDKLIKTGPLEKMKHIDEDCFVSPVVITVKNDKSIKIAIDSRKLNDSCIKIRPHMPNMEVSLNQISVEITRPIKEINYFENRSKLRVRPDKSVKRNKATMPLCDNRGKIQWIL